MTWIVLAMTCITVSGQNFSMDGIRRSVSDWGALRGCALGESRGAIAWCQDNAYSYVNLDNKIGSMIKEIHDAGQSIDYVSLADNGNYVIVGNNGSRWYALGPQAFYDALNDVMNNGGIKSASIDIFNHYFVLGKNGSIRTDVDAWRNFYNREKARLGEGRSAWTNGNVLIVCFDRGVSYWGYIPSNVDSKLKELTFVPDMVQVGKCGNYVFACNNGLSWYNLSDYGRSDYVQTVGRFPGANPTNSGGSSTVIVPAGTYPTTNPCGVCSSTGRCLQCNGTGKSPNHASGIIANCGYCGGTGRCGTCGGRGYN